MGSYRAQGVSGTIIAGIAGINADVFGERRNIERFSIAQRMSWASDRVTTRPEDIAYCLMGLFDVNMPVLYGEGEKAFIRLQQEIIKESADESIFAWRDESTNAHYSGMLATGPAAFVGSQNVRYLIDFDSRPPYVMTNRGLSITLTLHRQDRDCIAILNCSSTTDDGTGYHIGISLQQALSNDMQYTRHEPQNWIYPKVPEYHEISSIFIRNSLDGIHEDIRTLFPITIGTNNSNSPTLESEEDDDRHDSSISS